MYCFDYAGKNFGFSEIQGFHFLLIVMLFFFPNEISKLFVNLLNLFDFPKVLKLFS